MEDIAFVSMVLIHESIMFKVLHTHSSSFISANFCFADTFVRLLVIVMAYCCKWAQNVLHPNTIWNKITLIQECIQKFPYWVDNKIYAYNNKHLLRSNTGAKLTRLIHKIAVQPHLVAESSTICSSRSRQAVWKLLDTPSYIDWFYGYLTMLFQLHRYCRSEW
jgi:hypothetical protein